MRAEVGALVRSGYGI